VNRRNLQDHLASYYADRTLAPDKTARLLALAQSDMAGGAASNVARIGWSTRSVLALAATVAITASGLTVWTMSPNPPAASRLTGGTPNQRSSDPTKPDLPRLVAVKFQADGCPVAKAVEPKFVEAEHRFGTRDVLFCRLDITTTTAQQQSRYLAESLGIDCVYGFPCRSGTLMLVDRKQDKVLAMATDVSEVPQWESALAQAVR